MKRSTGFILIGWGVLGLVAAINMFGDIGLAAGIGAVTAIFTGVGFLEIAKALRAASADAGGEDE